MTVLKLEDIQSWLSENKEYRDLDLENRNPDTYPIEFMYQLFAELIKYYQYEDQCANALVELKKAISSDFPRLSEWVQNYEVLGSQNLLMFEINYFDWNEAVNNDRIKIHEGIYTEKKPFISIICFCKVFQYLFWEDGIHESESIEQATKIKFELENYFNSIID
jgi:hypothetical protein